MRKLLCSSISISALIFCLASSVIGNVFDVNVGWIYYQDNSGREIDYDFSDATTDQYGVIEIPAHAVSAPPSESGTTFLWEPGFKAQKVAVVNGTYKMSIPQATDSVKDIQTAVINVDGSAEDWNDVGVYIEDNFPDVRWGPEASADVNYIKAAYSPDYSKLYILIKLGAAANQDVWYRFFLDKDLDLEAGEPEDYQIDIQYTGSSWDVVSQGWDSPNEWDWYPVEENGAISVSGNYVEISVDSNAFDLPESVNIYGRTIAGSDPYGFYDLFSTDFLETEGFSSLGAYGAAAPSPTEWQFITRISSFRNPGFGDGSVYLHWYVAGIGVGSNEPNDLEPFIDVSWINGHYENIDFNNSLLIEAYVENDLDGNDAYEWSWVIDDGNGVVIEGLDPNTAILDLKVDVTNTGQSVSFYYRINSDDAADWQLAVTHELPGGTGTMYGFYDVFPTVCIGSGFLVYACDFNKDGFVDFSDFSSFAIAWLSERGGDHWDYTCDVSEVKDGKVDYSDLIMFGENWLKGAE